MLLKFCIGSLFVASLLAQTPSAPTGLTVVSATNKQVQLKWTAVNSVATGYLLQRKVDPGDYATILTINSAATATATDNTIDPYTTYQYRVLANVQTTQTQSSPSNEVIVGPPPYGYNQVVPFPATIDPNDSDQMALFANVVRMVLDTNGDPAMAYLWLDPNYDRDWSDSTLYFVRWDRANYRWTDTVKVAVPGTVSVGVNVPVSLAQDATNGMFGIAFEDESNADVPRISIALSSDGGQHWQTQTVASDPTQSNFYRPSLALNAGNVYISFYHEADGIRYMTGKQTDAPGKWTALVAGVTLDGPNRGLPPGLDLGVLIYNSLALDRNGNPAVAFIAQGDSGSAELFWRPGSTPIVAVRNDPGGLPDGPDIRLIFYSPAPPPNTQAVIEPMIALFGALDPLFFDPNTNGEFHTVWVIKSSNNGGAWTHVWVPNDLGTLSSPPFTFAAGSQGQTALALVDNGGDGSANCGDPKLAIVSPDLNNRGTCGISLQGTYGVAAGSPQVAFAANDTLFLAFQQTDSYDSNALPLGLILWRQPPGWGFPPAQ